MWYVYVLRCNDGSLYTGATNNVARRVATHAAGRGARYTRTRGPLILLGAWSYPDQGAALRAERRFKTLTRAAKLARIAERAPFLDGPFVAEVLEDPAVGN
jgi:putative endonuclease